jgi:hypothetical protein
MTIPRSGSRHTIAVTGEAAGAVIDPGGGPAPSITEQVGLGPPHHGTVIDLAAPSYSVPPRYDRGDAENALSAFQRDGDWPHAVTAIVHALLAIEERLQQIWLDQ